MNAAPAPAHAPAPAPVPDAATTSTADTAAATHREEGAREGPPTPSLHVRLENTPPRPAVAADVPVAPTPPIRLRVTASSTASRLYHHDHVLCGPHKRRTIYQNGRALLLCPNQGFHIATHDALAVALAFEAPRLPMGEWPGSYRYPSAVRSVVAVRLASQAPGGHWKVPDVVVPPNTYADVTIHHASSESRVRGAHDGRTCVLHGLHLEEEGKLRHYQRERAPGGPLAPATGTLVPFAITSGGLLAPSHSILYRK